MNPAEFRALPPLIHRSQVVSAGLPDDAIDGLRYEISSASDVVPFGRLGAVRGLARRRQRKGKGNFLYRKMDLAPLLGPKYL